MKTVNTSKGEADNMRIQELLIAGVAILAMPILLAASSTAQGSETDCSELVPEYYDPDYPYTELELMELRSQELQHSLSGTDLCTRQSNDTSGNNGNGGGNGSSGNGGGGSGGGSNPAASSSGSPSPSASSQGPVAGNIQGNESPTQQQNRNNSPSTYSGSQGPIAGNIQGTEPPPQQQSSTRQQSQTSEAQVKQAQQADNTVTRQPDQRKNSPSSQTNNGANTKKIRKVNNDDAVAQAIRNAAEAETDPARKQALWDEYYRYTGRKSPR